MERAIAAALALAIATAAPAAAQSPAPMSLSGTIASVNYMTATVVVDASGKRTTVTLTPSTSIVRGSTDEALADLKRGMHVEIDLSRTDGHFIAQIVRIR